MFIYFRQDFIKEEKVLEIVEILKCYGKFSDLIIVNFFEEYVLVFEKFREFGKIKYICVLCKWLMLRKVCRIGYEIGVSVIIMGDFLGQVVFQIFDNLMVVSIVSDLLILRLFIGLDKEEIVRIVKEIGMFEISLRKEFLCLFMFKYLVVCVFLGEF